MTTATRVRKITEKEKLRDLLDAVDIAFVLIGESDMKEVSNRTGLSVRTLYRLKGGRITLRVQCRTVVGLASAAGLKLHPSKNGRILLSLEDVRQ